MVKGLQVTGLSSIRRLEVGGGGGCTSGLILKSVPKSSFSMSGLSVSAGNGDGGVTVTGEDCMLTHTHTHHHVRGGTVGFESNDAGT